MAEPSDGLLNESALRVIRRQPVSRESIREFDVRLNIWAAVISSTALCALIAFHFYSTSLLQALIAGGALLPFLYLGIPRVFGSLFRGHPDLQAKTDVDFGRAQWVEVEHHRWFKHDCIREYWNNNHIGLHGLAENEFELLRRVDKFLVQGKPSYRRWSDRVKK